MVKSQKALIEALLFTTSEPLHIKEIKEVTELGARKIKEIIKEIRDDYDNPNRGVQLLDVNGGYQIRTKPEYEEYIKELHKPEINNRLTQASLETLTIVAYKQPVTRAEVQDIRGVNVEKPLKTLQKRGLVIELGRKETIGNPIIYGTSDKFLEYFGLNDLSELPSPQDFSELNEETLLEEELEDEELEELKSEE
ncbi:MULTISPECIES: SMC-Scp complex subunit ScpB [unclassified Candidatus Frackibacter]|uniref:SMC-Scp complex subunit ScpB n=1 Tax=unclassified Candidatus Frackibacter TaxID=2648818 RepID=UPI00088934C8|nr:MULTISPECIES: SMC-Scp complex subunit ScpB [unclassified Candidatus Frackibacter]SDC01325.1 segregation and condensation protein B [Candidatus Frackibacter sp. WG11]SEM32580.1 segregation and condensation protein B [Candidatus Frackibacter sp. WG12]SFL37535.1 segregation and condensation protein B [Candidatus Frackibacter sp. WG13]